MSRKFKGRPNPKGISREQLQRIAERLAVETGWSASWIMQRKPAQVLKWADRYL